ncbi:MAG: polysaccharide deacetylase family protein [Gammaproteobacteria bacterium]|jgi:polysaccharide deacetylase family protein (PEP-CTERM system associated)
MAQTTSRYFTLDLEDHRPRPDWPKRYPDITRKLLDFLDERRIEATVFVLGRVAREEPALIAEIARRGHEIGFHSFAHRHLTRESPQALATELTENKAYLEDLTGRSVIGYRAPAFSLTRDSLWATELIRDAGFAYSSSVLPAASPLFGFPGAPRQPFQWPHGLLEIPAPVACIGPLEFPFLGGFYLRYLPTPVIHYCLAHGPPNQAYWLYCHPHDFDYEESFYRIAGTSFLTSALLWFNRKNTFRKLARVIDGEQGAHQYRSFAAALAAGEFASATPFAP